MSHRRACPACGGRYQVPSCGRGGGDRGPAGGPGGREGGRA